MSACHPHKRVVKAPPRLPRRNSNLQWKLDGAYQRGTAVARAAAQKTIAAKNKKLEQVQICADIYSKADEHAELIACLKRVLAGIKTP